MDLVVLFIDPLQLPFEIEGLLVFCKLCLLVLFRNAQISNIKRVERANIEIDIERVLVTAILINDFS